MTYAKLKQTQKMIGECEHTGSREDMDPTLGDLTDDGLPPVEDTDPVVSKPITWWFFIVCILLWVLVALFGLAARSVWGTR